MPINQYIISHSQGLDSIVCSTIGSSFKRTDVKLTNADQSIRYEKLLQV